MRTSRPVATIALAMLAMLAMAQASSATPPTNSSSPSSPPSTPAPVGSTNSADSVLDTLRARPVNVGTIVPGAPCPVTTALTQPSAELGVMLGDGDARPVGLGTTERPVLELSRQGDFAPPAWPGNKVLWALSATAPRPVLVRGGQLDGGGQLGFLRDSAPSLELVLDVAPDQPIPAGGWYDFPGSTRVEHQGCYGYQIDSLSGTTVVVFVARDAS